MEKYRNIWESHVNSSLRYFFPLFFLQIVVQRIAVEQITGYSKKDKQIPSNISKILVQAWMLCPQCPKNIIGSLSTRVFETRTATGSELFSLLTCRHTTTFIF